MSASDDLYELPVEECWELLRAQEFGRLAFTLVDELHITPINYAVDGETLLFRTAAGNKLFSVELGGEVAFEIDEIDDETEQATSVVVRGSARHLEEDEAHRADNLPLRPWLGTDKPNVVEIAPVEVTGRRFPLSRPWLRMRTD
ncbi:pyridoxamine 5'-phosphate oxidase family protein [Nocardioides caricicola]|uniref:Pyridoxamine 5'-phosphate oxidase family protein n=1 Tax=Nocardioides caricicola TaxID=634770 RepID=A0ABW0MYN4_9ACTN